MASPLKLLGPDPEAGWESNKPAPGWEEDPGSHARVTSLLSADRGARLLSHALSRPHSGCLPLIKHYSLLHPHSTRSSPVNWTGQRQVGHAVRGWQLGRWNALAWIVCQTKFLGKPRQSAMPRRSCWKNPRALPFFISLRVSLVDSAHLPDDHVLRLSVMLQSCKILLPSMLSEVSPTF